MFIEKLKTYKKETDESEICISKTDVVFRLQITTFILLYISQRPTLQKLLIQIRQQSGQPFSGTPGMFYNYYLPSCHKT